MSMFRGFEMQIENDGAIESEQAEEEVLYLQVGRFERAAKSGEDQHDGGESERSPVVREQSPGSGCSGECTEIRMDGQQGTIWRVLKQIFPARADTMGIDIEDNGAEGEKDTGREC